MPPRPSVGQLPPSQPQPPTQLLPLGEQWWRKEEVRKEEEDFSSGVSVWDVRAPQPCVAPGRERHLPPSDHQQLPQEEWGSGSH